MATNTQRVQAIANALINGTATPAQINRIGLGLSREHPPFSDNYAEMTSAEKAGFIVSKFRQIILSHIKQNDAIAAARAAPVADPAAVDAEFAETP